eukprot:2825186-Karenia_brevis.AAC.1
MPIQQVDLDAQFGHLPLPSSAVGETLNQQTQCEPLPQKSLDILPFKPSKGRYVALADILELRTMESADLDGLEAQ